MKTVKKEIPVVVNEVIMSDNRVLDINSSVTAPVRIMYKITALGEVPDGEISIVFTTKVPGTFGEFLAHNDVSECEVVEWLNDNYKK